MSSVKVAIVGVGNCAASLVQGVEYYRDADETKSAHARFMVLHEGRIRFEGTAQELLASTDPFLERFLFMTLPPW